ncbi:hypothetical protein CFC21_101918 [Triticum aestivum]|uniref:TF-B3 domain-containing protein n=2 Tax=Triticum aestivum TaxID=4565 RepID=A0A3B6SG57_WHEAT|nr:hypothetical protein CFC21_101918 [Triticum aestivum]
MFAVNQRLLWQFAAAAAAALRPPVAICRAQSPAARAIKKRKKRHDGAFWAGVESTSPSAGAAMGVDSLDEIIVVDRMLRVEEDLGRGERFLAADQGPPPCSADAALRPSVAIRRARSPALGANKKRKKHQEREFWAALGVNSLDEVTVVDRRVRAEEDLGRRGRPLGATRAIKKREDGVFWAGMESTSWSAAGPAPGVDSLDEIAAVDGKLRDVLRGLGASVPVRIYGKRLSKSDRVINQHRLLMPCRSWRHGEPLPFDEVLTAEEKPSVQVQAYDRVGRPYVLDCKKLECNKSYRLIAGWRRFLTENGLAVSDDARAEDLEPAMVELWAFRSPALTMGVAGQPRGALGLVIVHYRQGDAPHADAAIAEVPAAARNRAAMPLPVVVPVLEHAVGAPREDAMEEADDGGARPGGWPDARTLEAAEALLMLSER